MNEYYFRRIDAMEFTISHDDGRNPQDLREADIVLIRECRDLLKRRCRFTYATGAIA